MEKLIRYIFKSFLTGITMIFILYILTFPLIKLYNNYNSEIKWYYILAFILFATILGAISKIFYFKPFNTLAELFLKLFTNFYKEFLLQSAKYFTKSNKSKPFKKVVEIQLEKDIKIIGFLTNKLPNGNCIIFIPTSPNPTSGFIINVSNNKITETEITPEDLLKYTITSGAHVIKQNI